MDDCPVVSVVVPAFNAATTIRDTLCSISQQTYQNLDVIVVDDGSTDSTATLVREHCLVDHRFRLLSQANSGVAAARNAGIRASKGDFVAFIDADDLWHPTKISKSVKVLLSSDPDVALVYSPSRRIDIQGNVISSSQRPAISGWVLHQHLQGNVVGNGSSILVRKSVLDEVGGFDPWLRKQGAEGCEDLLLQIRIAARYRFAGIAEYLVGYRRRPGAMSTDTDRMTRSGMLALSKALSECNVRGVSARTVMRRYEWKRLKLCLKHRRGREALDVLRRLSSSPSYMAIAMWNDMLTVSARFYQTARDAALRRNTTTPRRHFYEYDPADVES